MSDDIIQKRHVRLKNKVFLGTSIDGDGNEEDVFQSHQVDDFVPVEDLDAYLALARENGWTSVQVINPDTHDAGPAGDSGETHRITN